MTSSIRPNNPFIEFRKEEIEQSIPLRFEKQAAKYPKKIAIKYKNLEFTYADLNTFSNRIAHLLLGEYGAKQEPVALSIEQGPFLIGAILGILKSGNFYVPIDPSDPKSRILYALDDARINLIITDAKNLSLSNDLGKEGLRIINIDTLDHSSLPADNPNNFISPDSFAYIFFTSGSTGKPKGVVDNHRNVLHNIMRYTNNLHICSDDRLTLLQSCSFSGSVSSLFCSLLNGATVFPYDIRAEGMGIQLAAWLIKEGITIYHSVPMIFRSFLGGDFRFPKIRIIRLEGDAASKIDVELFKKHFETGCVLVNGLGATETGITRQYFINHDMELSDNILPIGYPVEDMEIQILGDDGKEVETDWVGEIAIKSIFLSPGYWGNPELTKNAFLPDPSGGNKRIYKTGDLGRMRADGCLEYFGRKNFQLKIRGHKVEAAEIERALLNLRSIREAIVMTREDQHGEPQLVAYIVPAEKRPITIRTLRQALAENLPDYMIPSLFVILESLPLNSNGKVDRRALPDPDQMRLRPESSFTLPRNSLEWNLTKIWEEVLGIRNIGIRDNFFDLGGDSLKIAKVIAEIKKIVGKELPLSAILQAPTIERLALFLHQGQSEFKESALIAIQPHGSQPPLFFVHGHYGGAFYTSLARYLGNDHPFYGLQSLGYLKETMPLTQIEMMATKYISEIRSVYPEGPYCLAGLCFGGVVAFEMAQQLQLQNQKIGMLALVGITPKDFAPLLATNTGSKNWKNALLGKIRGKYFQMRILKTGERISHINALLLKAMQSIPAKIKMNVDEIKWNLAFKIFAKINRPLPRFFWNIPLANKYAFKMYVPRTYHGHATLFLSRETMGPGSQNAQVDWFKLATDGITIYELPGNQPGLAMQEPYVGLLADKLKFCLSGSKNNDISKTQFADC
jgi:amino acid adenylation domain-containing protein